MSAEESIKAIWPHAVAIWEDYTYSVVVPVRIDKPEINPRLSRHCKTELAAWSMALKNLHSKRNLSV
jgi:hypothetical protein